VKTRAILISTIEEGICGDLLYDFSTQCLSCTHLHKDLVSCKAYPKGIPDMILSGKVDHSKSYLGDNGIQFVQRKEPK